MPTHPPTLSQVAYKAQHSGAVVACVENAAKAAAFLDNHKILKRLKAIVVWDPEVRRSKGRRPER